jgi:hypothetical protein
MNASPFDPIVHLPRLEPLAPKAEPGQVAGTVAGQANRSPHTTPSFAETLAHLEAQARDLKERSAQLAQPSDLGDALLRARDSLEGVLALRERLLASARAAQEPPSA